MTGAVCALVTSQGPKQDATGVPLLGVAKGVSDAPEIQETSRPISDSQPPPLHLLCRDSRCQQGINISRDAQLAGRWLCAIKCWQTEIATSWSCRDKLESRLRAGQVAPSWTLLGTIALAAIG